MEDLINGIARLFGILYRTIFQLIPSGLLIVVSFLVINRLHPNEVDQFVAYFNNLQTYQIVFLAFITLYTFNTIIDGISEFIVQRVFEFGQQSKLRNTLPKNYGDSIDRMQNQYVKKTNLFTNDELLKMQTENKKIELENSLYDFAIIDSLKFHKDIYNYIQYKEGLLDLFSNTFVVLLIIFTSLVPYFIFQEFHICFPLLMIVQIPVIAWITAKCFSTLKRVNYNGEIKVEHKDGYRKALREKYWFIITGFILGMILLACFIQHFNSYSFDFKNWIYGFWLLLIMNSIFIPTFYVLLMTSFRNYMFVDRACVSYQLLRNFGHDFFKEPVNPKE